MSLNPDDHEFDAELTALYSAKEYDTCLAESQKKLSENPLNLQALLYIADISLRNRELNDCIHYCDTIIQAIEDRIFYVWSWRAQALCLQKKYKEAEDSFEQAIKYDPKNTETWSHLALTLFMQGKKDVAMELLRRVEEKLECPSKFAMVRGFIERADGNTDEALVHFLEGGMAVDPTSPDYDESKEVYAREARKTLEDK